MTEPLDLEQIKERDKKSQTALQKHGEAGAFFCIETAIKDVPALIDEALIDLEKLTAERDALKATVLSVRDLMDNTMDKDALVAGLQDLFKPKPVEDVK